MGAGPTDDLTFRRGAQLTDADGVAELATIYPGWYAGRALHIHLKVMVGGSVSSETYEGGIPTPPGLSGNAQITAPRDATSRPPAQRTPAPEFAALAVWCRGMS